MKKYIIYIFILVLSCQYPVNQSVLPPGIQYMVIEADLSEQSFTLNLQYSIIDLGANGAYGIPRRPRNVSAYIQNSNGQRTQIKRIDGVPDTTIKGIVGETYSLRITADGKDYQSIPETMRPCPEITAITTTFDTEVTRSPNDLYYHGFDVILETNDLVGVENFYQWDWIHYEKALSCGKRDVGTGEVQYPCAPRDCWDIVYNTSIISQSDALLDGKPITKRIARVPFINPPLKYYLKVEQRSITPNMYGYLKSLENQSQVIGTLFDLPPSTKFSPNIKSLSDPSEKIIGAFNVFSNRTRVIYVDLTQKIPGINPIGLSDPAPFVADPFATLPCVEGQYRTKIKPIGWID